MTGLFDGMTGLFSDVFGSSVTYLPASGAPRAITSIFRESPIEIAGADGQILRIEAPTWRVQRNQAPAIRYGDRLALPDGRIFAVMAVHPASSPAADAFILCECQLVEGA